MQTVSVQLLEQILRKRSNTDNQSFSPKAAVQYTVMLLETTVHSEVYGTNTSEKN
jgi:hypothetical protein